MHLLLFLQNWLLLTTDSPSSSSTTISASLGCLRVVVPKLKALLLEVEVPLSWPLEKLRINMGPLPCNCQAKIRLRANDLQQFSLQSKIDHSTLLFKLLTAYNSFLFALRAVYLHMQWAHEAALVQICGVGLLARMPYLG